MAAVIKPVESDINKSVADPWDVAFLPKTDRLVQAGTRLGRPVAKQAAEEEVMRHVAWEQKEIDDATACDRKEKEAILGRPLF